MAYTRTGLSKQRPGHAKTARVYVPYEERDVDWSQPEMRCAPTPLHVLFAVASRAALYSLPPRPRTIWTGPVVVDSAKSEPWREDQFFQPHKVHSAFSPALGL